MTARMGSALQRAAALLTLISCARSLAAQTSAAVTIQMPVNLVLALSLTGADPTPLTAPAVTDYDGVGNATKDNTGPLAHVVSNAAWKVTVAGSTSTFTGTGYAKSAADLTWGLASLGTYPFDMSVGHTLMSGSATNGQDGTINYRTNWHLTTDKPGTYSLIVNFTLSSP